MDPERFCCVSTSLESVLSAADFLYVTRVQQERLAAAAATATAAAAANKGGGDSEGLGSLNPNSHPNPEGFCITAELLRSKAKPTLKVSPAHRV